MKKFFFKSGLYVILILLTLEILVRVTHLSKDNPTRFVDEFNVEKWEPNQKGHSVTGNRLQNFSEFNINNSGYNSYREFVPSIDKVELALVGDSFIQGFHQNYYNSIGKKIEDRLEGIEVYEYGYAGYDLADQLHLIHAYKETFDKIDHVVIGLKFDDDLIRKEYKLVQDRMHLESPFYKKIRSIKLLVYTQNIGVLDPLWKLAGKLSSIGKKNKVLLKRTETKNDIKEKYITYIENFKSLIKKYGFDKNRFTFLLDTNVTPQIFLNYLKDNNFKYIDTYVALNSSKKPTTLIYDMHWNNHGRDIIADIIINYYKLL
ncbi:PLP-dependent aminotransferase family protein [Flavivirga rizhaonensis]|uniref:SGNH/GDSL hydrolase family protein n=1 Tax=Flavivirga rizhaonensis TaxID=2559571 RepID=A0A4V3P569_9FLAO|nr:hypothetical protein [Flavivirga rizhaonensis]TGV04074.1 hypothetical protein EM932_03775 [Flavivirga rizhaonensis]